MSSLGMEGLVAAGPAATPAFPGAFSPRARLLGVVYVLASLPLVALLGALLVHDSDTYVVTFVLVASATYTTPALVITRRAAQRAGHPDREAWNLWRVALVSLYVTGSGMLLGVVTDWATHPITGVGAVVVITGLLTIAAVRLARARSGGRALSVDVVECVIAAVTVTAPAALLWGEQVVTSDDAWFAVPAALSVVGMVSGCYWAAVLYLRLGAGGERTTELFGILLTTVGALNGMAQTAQGVSGFTLPAAPLVTLQALSASLIMLVPLFLPRNRRQGLGSLPLRDQVRGGGLAAIATLVGVPVLLGTTALVQDETSWAVPFTTGVLALLLALGCLRHLATTSETHRLYAQVEAAADERRQLLTAVMKRADLDRHRVAAQLHEQAVAAYASFVSFIQASGTSLGDRSSLTTASRQVRDDLARHADSLRQLLTAIAPMDAAADRAEPGPLIRAYLDNLYDNRPAPQLRVSMSARLVLDWPTETIALRIIQEALRNVRRHSRASNVEVMIDEVGESIEVHVVDDGIGFDPTRALFETGIAAMREFAALTGGTIDVASAPGRGTTVTARLGRGRIPDEEPPDDEAEGPDAVTEYEQYEEYDAGEGAQQPSRRLRLLPGGLTDA